MRNPLRTHTLPAAKLALLRRVPAFRGCTERQLADIATLVDETTVEEGHELTREGDRGREAFVIVDGWAAVVVGGELVAALGPGEFVGEVAMLDTGPRTATVVAKTPMVLLAIGPRAFATLAGQPPLARSLLCGLAVRLRQADAERAP